MAATETGVWDLQDVRDKQLAGNWTYSEPNTLWSWGTNNYGQVGVNHTAEISSPTQIGALTTWKFINGATGGGGGNFAINLSGNLFAWGNNPSGQLGLSDKDKRSSPVQVGSDTTWKYISNAYGQGISAIKTDGTLWSWGNGTNGNLSQNNTTEYSSPRQVGTNTTWNSVVGNVSNAEAFWATKTDGTLWAWGSNTYGILAQSDLVKRSSPVQIGTETTWAHGQDKLCGGANHALATKTDGTLWSWGYNGFAVLGQNARSQYTHYSSPLQIPGTTWSSVTTNKYSVMARKTDGTIWTWGYNDQGELGQNDRAWLSSPTQVGTNATWKSIQIQGGWNAGFTAIKTDGSLWTWGLNQQGGLGLNVGPSGGNRSSPTQIPGTWTESTGKVYGAICKQQA